jgi:hypothetical protein
MNVILAYHTGFSQARISRSPEQGDRATTLRE